MKKLLLLAALVVCAPLPSMAQAQDDGVPKYVSDEILLSVREQPSNDAGTIGVIHSGDRVTLLRSLGEQITSPPRFSARRQSSRGRSRRWRRGRFRRRRGF